MNCSYCDKELNPKGLSHQTYCKKNPNRKIIDKSGNKNPMFGKTGSNQFLKAEKLGFSKPIVSEDTRKKNSIRSKNRKHDKSTIEKIRVSMQNAVRKNPESYSASNINGRVKKIEYKGFLLDGNWELTFAKWCDENGIKWERNKKGFEYQWNGNRLYYPDFYLSEFDIYIEIKGYQRDRDIEKWKSIPNLLVLKCNEIKKIKNNLFHISDYI